MLTNWPRPRAVREVRYGRAKPALRRAGRGTHALALRTRSSAPMVGAVSYDAVRARTSSNWRSRRMTAWAWRCVPSWHAATCTRETQSRLRSAHTSTAGDMRPVQPPAIAALTETLLHELKASTTASHELPWLLRGFPPPQHGGDGDADGRRRSTRRHGRCSAPPRGAARTRRRARFRLEELIFARWVIRQSRAPDVRTAPERWGLVQKYRLLYKPGPRAAPRLGDRIASRRPGVLPQLGRMMSLQWTDSRNVGGIGRRRRRTFAGIFAPGNGPLGRALNSPPASA